MIYLQRVSALVLLAFAALVELGAADWSCVLQQMSKAMFSWPCVAQPSILRYMHFRMRDKSTGA